MIGRNFLSYKKEAAPTAYYAMKTASINSCFVFAAAYWITFAGHFAAHLPQLVHFS